MSTQVTSPQLIVLTSLTSFPIEGSQVSPLSFFLSGDIVPRYAKAARTNMEAHAYNHNAEVLTWDAMRLPLKDQSVGTKFMTGQAR